MNIKWLGHASFLIQENGQNIYIDPYNLKSQLPSASVIFTTHTHYDHLSLDDIRKIITNDTLIVATYDAESSLGSFSNKKIFVVPEKEYVINDNLSVYTTPAYNIDKSFHPKTNNWVGYVLKFYNGKSFFHTGDSDNIPEYSNLSSYNITFMAVACGGTYTMNADEAADAAKIVNPEEVIPMHWGSVAGNRKDADKVAFLLKDTNIKVNIMGQ